MVWKSAKDKFIEAEENARFHSEPDKVYHVLTFNPATGSVQFNQSTTEPAVAAHYAELNHGLVIANPILLNMQPIVKSTNEYDEDEDRE